MQFSELAVVNSVDHAGIRSSVNSCTWLKRLSFCPVVLSWEKCHV